jgi:hypothetical protein
MVVSTQGMSWINFYNSRIVPSIWITADVRLVLLAFNSANNLLNFEFTLNSRSFFSNSYILLHKTNIRENRMGNRSVLINLVIWHLRTRFQQSTDFLYMYLPSIWLGFMLIVRLITVIKFIIYFSVRFTDGQICIF